jgi:hypothetical protein
MDDGQLNPNGERIAGCPKNKENIWIRRFLVVVSFNPDNKSHPDFSL